MNNNLIRFIFGIKNLVKFTRYKIIFILFIIVLVFFDRIGLEYLKFLNFGYFTKYYVLLLKVTVIIFNVLLIFALIIKFGSPLNSKLINEDLVSIELCDKSKSAPMLVSIEKKKNAKVYTYYSRSQSLEDFENLKYRLEHIIDGNIYSIENSRISKRIINVTFVPQKIQIPNIINWDKEKLLSNEDFVINLGRGLLGEESYDANILPHVLIAGGSGAGKTVLIKSILLQFLLKDAEVHLADFKGGIDYGDGWCEKCHLITDTESLQNKLNEFTCLIISRKLAFQESKVNNIKKYNKKIDKMPHVLLCIDELAEVLDKTGLDKEQKEKVDSIIKDLSTIARMGRAYGIHLLLCTQRPDADIIKGQIKNNLSLKICGRVDKVTSDIVLDNYDASKKIRPDDVGIFLTNTGALFRGYYIDDYPIDS